MGGIGLAVRLLEAGFDRLTLYERGGGVGGTWWHNTYPGAEVDTPSAIYSYSFFPWNWSRTHCGQAELQNYLQEVANRFGVTPHIRFGTDVSRVVWDDALQCWELGSERGVLGHADFVVSAVGMLSDPKYPDWPGLEDFEGPAFHTARWEHDHDLSGKHVAVVGSGSSGVQIVPALAEVAGRVTMFQREPGWIVPKNSRDFTEAERRALDNKAAQRISRVLMLLRRERGLVAGKIFRPGTAENSGAERIARDYIASVFADRPDLLEAVTPTYSYMGKRPITADNFYPSLLRDNVSLVPRAVEKVTSNGLIDTEGVVHEVDVLVVSTGFQVKYLASLDVVGRDGVELHKFWAGEPRAFLGMMVPNYPNFFMMYGPNTNGGAIATNLELQARYIVAAIKHARRRRASSIEVKRTAYDVFDAWLMGRLRGTAFEYQNNYYKTDSGRITTQWPDGILLYGALTKALRSAVWETKSRAPRSAVTSVGVSR